MGRHDPLLSPPGPDSSPGANVGGVGHGENPWSTAEEAALAPPWPGVGSEPPVFGVPAAWSHEGCRQHPNLPPCCGVKPAAFLLYFIDNCYFIGCLYAKRDAFLLQPLAKPEAPLQRWGSGERLWSFLAQGCCPGAVCHAGRLLGPPSASQCCHIHALNSSFEGIWVPSTNHLHCHAEEPNGLSLRPREMVGDSCGSCCLGFSFSS